MSELVLKVGAGANYEDGDILCAFNRRMIRCVHAQHLCFERGPDRRFARLNNGLLPDTDVARDFMEATHEFRFARTGSDTLTITRISDGQEINITSNQSFIGFNGRAQAMDVQEFVARRRESLARPNAQGIPMFGSDGREVWYGGKQDYSDAVLDTVWTAITNKLGRQDSEFPLWPAGRQDLKSHLFLPTDDFDDIEAQALIAPQIDDSDPDNPVTVHKRARRVDWRAIVDDIGESRGRIEDRTIVVDVREKMSPALDRGLSVDRKR